MKRDQIALQLYTVRERLGADPLGTLEAVAAMGYPAVEIAGVPDVPDFKGTLDRLGMKVAASHVSLRQWDGQAEAIANQVRDFGGRYAVLSFIALEDRGDANQTKALARNLNEWGETCQANGVTFAYHNHDFEFQPLPDDPSQTMMDIFLAETDPDLVKFECDLFWVKRGGTDPLAFLTEHLDRIPLLHVKDMAAGPDQEDTPFGTGVLPWDEIFAVAEGKAEWYIVEQDFPKDAMADVETSLRNLEQRADGSHRLS